jgi:hypothetical protein
LVDGSACFGVAVRAFDTDLRSQTLLGETRTDRDGGYEIRYGSSQLPRPEKLRADLVLEVYTDGSASAVWVRSNPMFSASPEATIDIVAPLWRA